ncbi:MAG TPA: histidine phosphatase family protein [Parvularculaceae bacterium]|nr:histidine phosphatase family protein [Parvularculaceae bacterium]
MTQAGRRRIYLMRHGHVDYFAPGLSDPRAVSLTDEGRRQAQACRDALRAIPFDLVLHSGLPRTRETAEIVLAANPRAPAPIAEPGFEELKSGWITAVTREELAARIAFCFDGAGEKDAAFLPDGEKFADAERRIVTAIEKTVLTRAWRAALIVAHEGVNRIMLGWATGGGLKSIAAFEQDLCCVNIIDVDVTPATSGGLKIERALLKAANLTPYDYAKGGLRRTSLEHLFEVDFGGARPRSVLES